MYPGHTPEHSPDAAEWRVNHHANCDVRQIKKCDRKWNWKEIQNEEFHDLYSTPNFMVCTPHQISWSVLHTKFYSGE